MHDKFSSVQLGFTWLQNGFITKLVFELDFAAKVDRGLVRKTNQDVARVLPQLHLALVADGMGGHEHGDIASRTASRGLERAFAELGGPGAHVEETAERLERAVREANQRLADHPATDEGRVKIGTTLVVAVFAHGRAIIGNIGDSRCYRLRNAALELLTRDHSYAEQLRRAGATATPEGKQAAAQWAHVLTRCLNGDEGATADTCIVDCEPGDIFLLCTDGLWGCVPDHVIVGTLGTAPNAEEACERLLGAAWAGGGLDNIGIAVVRLVPLQLHLKEPSWLEQPNQSTDQSATDG